MPAATPQSPQDPSPHQLRQVAESFGADAERYDRTRPAYPRALVDRIIAASPGPGVLDVGCGTGIEARQFKAAGCTVLGVEPDARMAEFARRSGAPFHHVLQQPPEITDVLAEAYRRVAPDSPLRLSSQLRTSALDGYTSVVVTAARTSVN